MNIAQLESDLARIRTEATTLYEKTARLANDENRLFTAEETDAITAKKNEGLAIQQKIAKAQADHGMLAEIERLTSTARPAAAAALQKRAQTWGEQFTAAPSYDFFRQGKHRSSSAWRSEAVELPWPLGIGGIPNVRATTLTEDPASGGALIIPQYVPGVLTPPPQPLVIAELFAQGTTSSNLITYMMEKAFTNAAAAVGEGALKPESTLTFESKSDAVRKIAHWLPVTEEMLEDEPAIRSYIDARLRYGVLLEEQDQILNGDGVAPNILGVLKRPGLAPDLPKAAGDTNADALLKQTMAIFASALLMPDGYVLNPANWVATLLSKTSTGEYFTGGPFSPIQSPTLWGLPVALSPAMAAGQALVGAYKTGGQIFRKGGVRVEASNSHADFFIKNLVAIRAEERLALAIYRPGAFGTVSALD